MAIGQAKVGNTVFGSLLGKATYVLDIQMNSFEKGLEAAEQKVGLFGASMTRTLRIAAGIAGISSGILGIRRTIEGTLGASLAFESSFANVRKTVEATEVQFQELQGTFREMARQFPTSVVEINNVAAAAGQLGIKAEDLETFTKVMIDLGNTTNLSAEEAAISLARFANIMQTSTKDFDRLGSALVDLGNNFPAFENEIANMSVRLGAAGKQLGLTEAQVLAFATTMISVGVKVEAGGSAMSRVWFAMAEAADTGGEKLEEMARVAGLTSEAFLHLIETDPSAAVLQFIQGLKRIDESGTAVTGVLEDLDFNTIRIRQALLNTAEAGDTLADALERGDTAWDNNNALTIEAEKRYSTMASRLTVLKNRMLDVGISIGDQLLPTIELLTQRLVGFVELLAKLEEKAGLVSAALVLLATVGFMRLTQTMTGGFISAISSVIVHLDMKRAAILAARNDMAFLAAAEQHASISTNVYTRAQVGAMMATKATSKAQAEAAIATQVYSRAMAGAQVQTAGLTTKQVALGASTVAASTSTNRLAIALSGLKGALGVSGTVTIAVGAFLALDTVVRSITSRGVIERLGDLFEKTDKVRQAVAELRGELDKYNTDATKIKVATDEYATAVSVLLNKIREVSSVEEGTLYSRKEQAVTLKRLQDDLIDTHAEFLALLYDYGVPMEEINTRLNKMSDEVRLAVVNHSEFKRIIEESAIAFREQAAAEEIAFEKLREFGDKAQDVVEPIQEAKTGIEALAEATGLSVEEIRDAYEYVQNATDVFNDSIRDSWSDILPDLDESIEDWEQHLQDLAESIRHEAGNIAALSALFRDAGIEHGDALIEAIREKGPIYLADFTKWVLEDPEVVLDELAEIAPTYVAQAGDNMVEEIQRDPEKLANATKIGLVNPITGQLRTLPTLAAGIANQVRNIIALAFNSGGVDLEALRPNYAGVDENNPWGFDSQAEIFGGAPLGVGGGTSDEGKSSSGGGGGGGGSAAEEAGRTAAEAFASGFVDELKSNQWEQEMGSAGARLSESLVAAIEDNSEANGERLAKAAADFIKEIEEEGATVGNDFKEAIIKALQEGTPEAIEAAIDIFKEYGKVLQEEAEEAAEDLMETFSDAVAKEAEDRRNEEKIGSAGVKLINYLEDGLENEKPSAIESAAGVADDIISTLEEEFGLANTAGFISHFMDTITRVISDKGGQAVAELTRILALIEQARRTGKPPTIDGTPDTPDSGVEVVGQVDLAGKTYLVGITSTGVKVIQTKEGWKPYSWNNVNPIDINPTNSGPFPDSSGYGGVNVFPETDPFGGTEGVVTGGGGTIPTNTITGIEGFRKGISMVPRNMVAMLHAGEAVVSKARNLANIRGGKYGGHEGNMTFILKGDLANLIEAIETQSGRRML